jgi:L-ascorbate metabolism protein UlaG (beta-lactamase superfamily)
MPNALLEDELLFIGNATVLLRYAGFTLLTDPNFIHRGESVPLGYGLSTERLTDPAIEIDDLPRLDAVILSHFHGDHFDEVAQERLDRELPIITNPQAAATLDEIGFRLPVGLDTWQSHELASVEGRLRITALPAQHAPAALSVALPDVMGSCIEMWRTNGSASVDTSAPPDLRMYISGDTIMYEGIQEIADRVPQIDIALVHLGGTRVMGLTVTMDADQGLEWMRTVKPELAVPIHYNDYEAFKSPLTDFQARVNEAGLEGQVRYVAHGDRLPLRRRTAALP